MFIKATLAILLGLGGLNTRPAAEPCLEDEFDVGAECIHQDEFTLQDGWKFYNRYSIDHPDTYIRLRG